MARRAAAPMTTRVEALSSAAPLLRMCICCLPAQLADPDPCHSGGWSGAADEVSSPRPVSTTLLLIECELDQTSIKKAGFEACREFGQTEWAGVAFPDFRSLQKFHCFLIDKAA